MERASRPSIAQAPARVRSLHDGSAVAAFPTTDREAEAAATRLGSGSGFADAVAHAADLLASGELEPSHPWLAALLWQRVRHLRDVALVPGDGASEPLLAAPGAEQLLHTVAPRDPSGRLAALADALAPDPENELRIFRGRTMTFFELIAEYAGCTPEEARQQRQRRRLVEALPRPGEEWGYECPSGDHKWLGRFGLDQERCPYCGHPPSRWERPPPYSYESRRRVQWRRRLMAIEEARFEDLGRLRPQVGDDDLAAWDGSRRPDAPNSQGYSCWPARGR